MTRYARGFGSKGCNAKEKHASTSWCTLKAQANCRSASADQKVDKDYSKPRKSSAVSEEIGGGEFWFDFRVNREKEIALCKMRPDKEPSLGKKHFGKVPVKSKVTKISNSHVPAEKNIVSPCVKREAVGMRDIIPNDDSCDGKAIRKNGERVTAKCARTYDAGRKLKVKLSVEGLKDLRRKEKALKREKKKVCFCCRRWGHQLAECPEFTGLSSSEMPSPAGGLCYHCGSTEHNVHQCSKKGICSHRFARCFICGEDGHLARQCVNNPNGKYPKGGSCRICGETSHLCSECPRSVNTAGDNERFLLCGSEGPVDSLPEDGQYNQQKVSPKKVIQF